MQSIAALRNAIARQCLAVFALAWAVGAAAGGIYPAASWEKSLPAGEAPWSAEALKALDGMAASMQTDSFAIVHRGAMVHAYGDIARPRNVYSVRKSVLSVLIGMAVDRGQMDMNQTIGSLDLDDVDTLSTQERSATVRQLLQSRSGVYHEAAYETRTAKAERPTRGSHPPGSFWYYNNWDFNALGAAFQKRTGKSVFEALTEELAKPLQFEDFSAPRDTEFISESVSRYPAYVMKLSARDLARVGLLMARDGRWRGQQLVSSQWVAESTTAHSTVGPGWQGYGYMWWVPRAAWPFWTRSDGEVSFAWGNGGQFLFVDRQRDLVIVHQADLRRFFSKQVTPESISPFLERILAAVPGQ